MHDITNSFEVYREVLKQQFDKSTSEANVCILKEDTENKLRNEQFIKCVRLTRLNAKSLADTQDFNEPESDANSLLDGIIKILYSLEIVWTLTEAFETGPILFSTHSQFNLVLLELKLISNVDQEVSAPVVPHEYNLESWNYRKGETDQCDNVLGGTLDCPVCLERYDHKDHLPKILMCGHTLCVVCVQGVLGDDTLHCPTCRQQLNITLRQVKRLPTNMNTLDAIENVCERCKERLYSSMCHKCGLALCRSCDIEHIVEGHMKDKDPLQYLDKLQRILESGCLVDQVHTKNMVVLTDIQKTYDNYKLKLSRRQHDVERQASAIIQAEKTVHDTWLSNQNHQLQALVAFINYYEPILDTSCSPTIIEEATVRFEDSINTIQMTELVKPKFHMFELTQPDVWVKLVSEELGEVTSRLENDIKYVIYLALTNALMERVMQVPSTTTTERPNASRAQQSGVVNRSHRLQPKQSGRVKRVPGLQHKQSGQVVHDPGNHQKSRYANRDWWTTIPPSQRAQTKAMICNNRSPHNIDSLILIILRLALFFVIVFIVYMNSI